MGTSQCAAIKTSVLYVYVIDTSVLRCLLIFISIVLSRRLFFSDEFLLDCFANIRSFYHKYWSSFKLLLKVITRMRLLCFGIGNFVSLFNQREARAEPIAACMCVFSDALNKLRVSTRNPDWFIALFSPLVIVIDRNNYFGIGFSTVI